MMHIISLDSSQTYNWKEIEEHNIKIYIAKIKSEGSPTVES